MRHLLFDRPRLTGAGDENVCTLAIRGALVLYQPEIAYRGTLDVLGAHGELTITDWHGDLPPATGVSLDRSKSQIVVTWPDYDPGARIIDIPNIDFQQGNVGFSNGSGISIVTIPDPQVPALTPDPDAPDAKWFMKYANVGGESASMSNDYIEATEGKTYTASVDIFRTSTRKHADGSAVRILFYDANKKQIGGRDGNVVKEQTDRQWHASAVSVQAPAGTKYARLGVSFYRIHDNSPVMAVNLKWNGQVIVPGEAQGTNGTRPFSISVTVRDAMGCIAKFTGTIRGAILPAVIGYWPCDEAAGTNVLHDHSGNGMDGVVVADPHVSLGAQPLRYGSNGSLRTTALLNQAATIDIGAFLTNPKQLTIECIACLDSKGSSTGFIAALNPVTSNEGRPALSSFGDVWTASNVSGAGINSTVKWDKPAHLLLTRDNDHGAFYINGALVASQNNPADVVLFDNLLRLLGGGSGSGSYGVVGRISDVRLWDGPVDDETAAAVASQYQLLDA